MSVFIIAEAGINHNGLIENAYKLVDVAVEAGVDAVKFQTFKAKNLVTKNANKADYQKQTTNKSETQFEMINKLELDIDAHKTIIKYCKDKGIHCEGLTISKGQKEYINSKGLVAHVGDYKDYYVQYHFICDCWVHRSSAICRAI